MFIIRKSFLVVLLILLTLVPTSCNNDDDSSNCQNVACTLVLVQYSVAITDQNQDPVALDAFKVINLENGNDITISLSTEQFMIAQQTGEYPLIQDGVFGVNQEKQIQFKGFINNQEVISSDYTVKTDCCHVDLVSGNLELVL